MDSKLIELCKLQLKSIAGDTENSFKKLTGNSVKAMEAFSAMQQSSAGLTTEMSTQEQYAELEKNIHSLLVNMQFFDEFNQRIEDVQEILNLIMLKYCDDDVETDEEHQQLLEEVSEIFSVRAECDVMQTIFPELTQSEESDAIELF